jgi:hypothetical protein
MFAQEEGIPARTGDRVGGDFKLAALKSVGAFNLHDGRWGTMNGEKPRFAADAKRVLSSEEHFLANVYNKSNGGDPGGPPTNQQYLPHLIYLDKEHVVYVVQFLDGHVVGMYFAVAKDSEVGRTIFALAYLNANSKEPPHFSLFNTQRIIRAFADLKGPLHIVSTFFLNFYSLPWVSQKQGPTH